MQHLRTDQAGCTNPTASAPDERPLFPLCRRGIGPHAGPHRWRCSCSCCSPVCFPLHTTRAVVLLIVAVNLSLFVAYIKHQHPACLPCGNTQTECWRISAILPSSPSPALVPCFPHTALSMLLLLLGKTKGCRGEDAFIIVLGQLPRVPQDCCLLPCTPITPPHAIQSHLSLSHPVRTLLVKILQGLYIICCRGLKQTHARTRHNKCSAGMRALHSTDSSGAAVVRHAARPFKKGNMLLTSYHRSAAMTGHSGPAPATGRDTNKWVPRHSVVAWYSTPRSGASR